MQCVPLLKSESIYSYIANHRVTLVYGEVAGNSFLVGFRRGNLLNYECLIVNISPESWHHRGQLYWAMSGFKHKISMTTNNVFQVASLKI